MIAKEYTTQELMAVCCAREIKNGDLIFVGVGIPMVGSLVATRTHAKEAVIVYEAGGVGALSRRIPWNVADTPTSENALANHEMWRLFGDTQAGFINKGIIGGAQIDKFGNINTTVIIGDQSYDKPKIRLPGSGGGNDIASLCNEIIIVMKLEKGKFVEKVDYITSPGHLYGAGQREAAGLRGKGPVVLITNKCIFRFAQDTKEMILHALYPNVTVEEVQSYLSWKIRIEPNLSIVEPPLQEEVDIIRRLDPNGIFLGGKSVNKEEDFDEFYEKMKIAYESFALPL